jgi:Leucine-rich repeat (LRR) protein
MRFLDCRKIGLHSDAFSSAKYLCVLDLSECFIQELPDSVGQLKQLRYLNAPKIQHWMIPNCITKLLKLFYLSFSGSAALLALPDSIGKMEDLMYLNLSGCSGLEKLPESFAKLKKLVHLDLSHCTNVTGVSESLQSLTNLEFLDISYCWNIRELPEHLGSLLKLKHLNMSGCDEIEELPGSFGNLKNLVHLDLSHCCQIKVTPDVLGGLTKLQHLNVSHCGCIGRTKVAEAMSNLTELRYLYLSGFMDTMCHDESAMSTSLEYISTLSNLEYLDLSCNVGLSHLPENIGSLGKLHTLNLAECSSLCSVPETIVQMHSLKLAYVKDCGLHSALLHHVFKVNGDAIKGSINIALLQAVNVTILKVYRLEEVKSIEKIKDVKLDGIKELRLVWSSGYHERVVEDHEVLRGLEPASTVQSLDIESYNSILFPDWLMGIPAYNFPYLTKISLVNLGNCISLPPLGQLPSLLVLVLRKMPSVVKIDEAFCGGAVAFPLLYSFTLDDMESLEVWNTTYSSGGYMFPVLGELRIYDCPKLRLKPCPPKANQWTIRGSDGVISSWEESMSDTGASTSSSPPVTELTIKGCKLPMHQWTLLHHLPALPVLCIKDEQSSEGSWSYSGGLVLVGTSNAKRIEIERYNYIMKANLMGTPAYNFLDLVRISLEDLDNCISLPPLGQLPNLKSLYLRGMQSIEKIEEDFCGAAGAFPGLESFTLSDMPNLKVCNTTYSCSGDVVSGYMFPSLRTLLIHGCPKLRLKPCPPKEAEEWTIEESDGVISMWGESTSDTGASTSSSPPVTKLTIQGCKLPMHQWRLLHHLPALPELCIKDCSDLTSSPEINRAQLLDWLGHLTSLKKLDFWNCKNIESLPESIQRLTKLEKLCIAGCPSLQQWCETEENEMKLAHIKEKVGELPILFCTHYTSHGTIFIPRMLFCSSAFKRNAVRHLINLFNARRCLNALDYLVNTL